MANHNYHRCMEFKSGDDNIHTTAREVMHGHGGKGLKRPARVARMLALVAMVERGKPLGTVAQLVVANRLTRHPNALVKPNQMG